ncbi:hypothetical protein [Thauera propionica]|nr:hypothetical protein [Thauera propionica]
MKKKTDLLAQDLSTDIQAQLAALAQQARQGLAALDTRIAELRERHEAMTRHAVSADAAAARIVADVRASIADGVKRMQHVATAAANLKAHTEYREITAITGDGRYEITPVSAPGPLGIMDRLSPATIITILDPSGEKLEAWALQVAQAAGCPETAPPAAQTAREADALMSEIETLIEQRRSAAKALDSLLGEDAHVREVAEAMRKMQDAPVGKEPAPEPRIGVFDADGKPLTVGGGDTYTELMQARHRDEALARSAIAGTFEGFIAERNELEDSALRAMSS